jgi:sigma-E factor negative regulatory protein RseA
MNIDNDLQLNEIERAHISDLADGLLRGAAFADVMALLNCSSQARAYWHGLHVAGDVLRGETTAHVTNTAKDMAFLDTFRTNLTKEPRLTAIPVPVLSLASPAIPSANDSFFNWKWVGGLSAAAAVVAFSWNLVSTTAPAPNGAGAQLAQSAVQAAPVATQTSAGVMLRNPQLDALIAAHNQVGGSSALQMPSGFLRSATFNPAVSNTVLSDK